MRLRATMTVEYEVDEGDILLSYVDDIGKPVEEVTAEDCAALDLRLLEEGAFFISDLGESGTFTVEVVA